MTMWRYRLYKCLVLVLWTSGICMVSAQLQGQLILPQINDTLYSYSIVLDQPLESISEFDFYDLDFHCMDELAVLKPTAPRTDFEIKNQNGIGEVYAEKDGVLYIKGFRMIDPYLSSTVKFIQFIGGIPLVNQTDITKAGHQGSQNMYLEYNREELPELLNLWAESYGYEKMRLKISLDFRTAYKGKVDYDFLNIDSYHKVETSYTFKLSEVQMKQDEWQVVALEEIPGRDQFLSDKVVSYNSYYNGNTMVPRVIEHTHPDNRLEFIMPYSVVRLPICSPNTAQIYVYPNPTLGNLNIRIVDLEPGTYDFAVYNIIGYKVWSQKLVYGEQDLFRLILPNLEKGIYLYSLKDKDGRYIQSRRLSVLEY